MVVETSIIIVNFRADEYVERLQLSLRELPKSEVIVVDNSDGSRGYGEGCNLGAQRAKGRFLIFLNPDIQTTPESMARLVSVLKKSPEIGLVGPQILNPDGSIEISCAAFPTPLLALVEYSFLRHWPLLNKFASRYRLSEFDHRHSRVVPLVGGSCLAVRKADFHSIGGFDENMFLYFEEFDLAYRMLSALKKQTYFCAEANITHFGQVSTSQIKRTSEHFHRSRRYWFAKTYGWRGKMVVYLLELLERLNA